MCTWSNYHNLVCTRTRTCVLICTKVVQAEKPQGPQNIEIRTRVNMYNMYIILLLLSENSQEDSQ